jgi:inorganic pyrophosphatase
MTDPLSPSIAPPTVEVLIETPRGSFAKRDVRGAVEFFSPLPCPFNYGCVPTLAAPDGDAQDAVVLGPRLQVGQRLRIIVRATVLFIDAGQQDNKLICASFKPSALDRYLVLGFFHFYALCKTLANRARGKNGLTRCLGWQDSVMSKTKLTP